MNLALLRANCRTTLTVAWRALLVRTNPKVYWPAIFIALAKTFRDILARDAAVSGNGTMDDPTRKAGSAFTSQSVGEMTISRQRAMNFVLSPVTSHALESAGSDHGLRKRKNWAGSVVLTETLKTPSLTVTSLVTGVQRMGGVRLRTVSSVKPG
jgi:hypothetical protein